MCTHLHTSIHTHQFSLYISTAGTQEIQVHQPRHQLGLHLTTKSSLKTKKHSKEQEPKTEQREHRTGPARADPNPHTTSPFSCPRLVWERNMIQSTAASVCDSYAPSPFPWGTVGLGADVLGGWGLSMWPHLMGFLPDVKSSLLGGKSSRMTFPRGALP